MPAAVRLHKVTTCCSARLPKALPADYGWLTAGSVRPKQPPAHCAPRTDRRRCGRRSVKVIMVPMGQTRLCCVVHGTT